MLSPETSSTLKEARTPASALPLASTTSIEAAHIPLPPPERLFMTSLPLDFKDVPQELHSCWVLLHPLLTEGLNARTLAGALGISEGQARIRLYRFRAAGLIMPARMTQADPASAPDWEAELRPYAAPIQVKPVPQSVPEMTPEGGFLRRVMRLIKRPDLEAEAI